MTCNCYKWEMTNIHTLGWSSWLDNKKKNRKKIWGHHGSFFFFFLQSGFEKSKICCVSGITFIVTYGDKCVTSLWTCVILLPYSNAGRWISYAWKQLRIIFTNLILLVLIPASTAHVVKRKLVRDKIGRTRRYDFDQMSRLPCNPRFKCELIRKQNSDDKANFNFLLAPKWRGQSISYY